jgi:hypothetical protein
MTGPNGHAHEPEPVAPAVAARVSTASRFDDDQLARMVEALEIPFDPSLIEWRVQNRSDNHRRGQIFPYADPRAYTDRLNKLFTPAGWTRKYAVVASSTFERSQDKKVIAKVFVTSELTIFGINTNSGTGEAWADENNALTSAEAQAFKRACSCFGLGRYLYDFEGVWVDLDNQQRPRAFPRLPEWATPDGWTKGLRPTHNGKSLPRAASTSNARLVREIEAMRERLGHRVYRGILKRLATVWSPQELRDAELEKRVLIEMETVEQLLHRAARVYKMIGEGPGDEVLASLKLSSIESFSDLDTLQTLVARLEEKAGLRRQET